MTRISRMLQTSHPNCHVQPMLWRFDQLLKAAWHEMSLRDARQAVSLALAVSAEAALDKIPEGWLGALMEQAKGHSLHVLVMIGDTAPWTITLEQRSPKLRRKDVLPDKSPSNHTSAVPVRLRAAKPVAPIAA